MNQVKTNAIFLDKGLSSPYEREIIGFVTNRGLSGPHTKEEDNYFVKLEEMFGFDEFSDDSMVDKGFLV